MKRLFKLVLIVALIAGIGYATIQVTSKSEKKKETVEEVDPYADPYDENLGKQLADITDTYPPKSLSDLTKWYGSGNLSASANFSLVGQCTWYAYGRFYETTGIQLRSAKNAKYWLDANKGDSRVKVTTKLKDICDDCIAVKTSSEYGHVIFVEHVVYKDDDPWLVYYSECNLDKNGQIDKDECVVKKRTYKSFVKKRHVAGYIIAK